MRSSSGCGGGEIFDNWVRRVVITVFVDMFVMLTLFPFESLRNKRVPLQRILEMIMLMVCCVSYGSCQVNFCRAIPMVEGFISATNMTKSNIQTVFT